MRTWAQFFPSLEGPNMFVSVPTSQADSMVSSRLEDETTLFRGGGYCF